MSERQGCNRSSAKPLHATRSACFGLVFNVQVAIAQARNLFMRPGDILEAARAAALGCNRSSAKPLHATVEGFGDAIPTDNVAIAQARNLFMRRQVNGTGNKILLYGCNRSSAKPLHATLGVGFGIKYRRVLQS